MKLIFVNRYFYPDLAATAQLVGDLAFALAADGAEVRVITSAERYDDPAVRLPRSEAVGGVRIRRVRTSRFGRRRLLGRLFDYLSFYLTASWALWRTAAPGDRVVVMTDPPLLAVAARPIAAWRRAGLVNWLQDLFPEIAARRGLLSETGLLARSMLWLRDQCLRKADLNVAISRAMSDYLATRGVPTDRLETIPNWTDGRCVYPVPADENELRQAWGLAGKLVIGHSGNLGRVHEVATIEAAMERLGRERDLAFLFIGGGVGFEALRRWAERGKLENVHFHPYQPRDQLHLSLSIPDVHLVSLAPDMEGLAFTSKLYGALAVGRPVIFVGAAESEAAEILADGACGICVEAGRPNQLLEAVQRLRDDPPLRQRMGQQARALFERAYDKDIALQRWRKVLLRTDESKISRAGGS